MRTLALALLLTATPAAAADLPFANLLEAPEWVTGDEAEWCSNSFNPPASLRNVYGGGDYYLRTRANTELINGSEVKDVTVDAPGLDGHALVFRDHVFWYCGFVD
jgi:hypothetical protein